MRKLLLATVVLGVAVGTAWTFTGAAQKDDDDKKKPKYSIKEVMKKAHASKDPPALLTKAKEGKATEKELKELVVMYESLAKNKPPKGDLKDWEKRTTAMVKAAEAAVKDEKNVKALAKIVNCAECHKEHKGK
jgi:hypothetical protein